jgi:hypothetical protein
MPEFTGARVVARQLVKGYAEAFERFEAATRNPAEDPAFFALRVAQLGGCRRRLRPAGLEPERPGAGMGVARVRGRCDLEDLLNGMRYARNLVHHHWADALSEQEGHRYPKRYPVVFWSWIWRPADQLPVHPNGDKEFVVRNRDAYSRRFAAVRAEDTLLAVRDAFAQVGRLLEAPRP